MPFATARSMLSFGIEASRAFWIASARAGFPSGSPPPSRAATVIARVSFVKSAPRLASTAFFLCLIDAHLECPAMAFKSMDRKPMFVTSMRGFRESLSRPLHADGNPWDDGPLPDFTSGLMWTATGLFGGVRARAARLRPRATSRWRWALGFFAVAWGVFSLAMAARGRGMAIEHACARDRAMMPVVALSLWATGGATSFIQPVMIFTALFIAYFFPPRLAWPLMALFGYAYATPLFYDERAVDGGLSGAARDVRARGGRRDGRDPVPEGPPRARRAAPAHDGRARPAHRRERTGAASTPRSSAPPRQASPTR